MNYDIEYKYFVIVSQINFMLQRFALLSNHIAFKKHGINCIETFESITNKIF